MQKFPDNTRDEIEKEYGIHVLKIFPSYGVFWKKFIGDNNKYPTVLFPRDPIFPDNYSKKDKKENVKPELKKPVSKDNKISKEKKT